MTTMGDGAERSYSSDAPPDKFNSGSADNDSQARRTPSAPDQTSTQAPQRAADAKREGQDSSEDNESATPTRTRSKSSFSAGDAGQNSGNTSQTAPPFASVFAEAVTAAHAQAVPQAVAAIQTPPQPSGVTSTAPTENRVGQFGVAPASLETITWPSGQNAAATAPSETGHAKARLQSDAPQAAIRSFERVLPAGASGKLPASQASTLPAASMTLPSDSTTTPASYAYKPKTAEVALQTSDTSVSQLTAPLTPAAPLKLTAPLTSTTSVPTPLVTSGEIALPQAPTVALNAAAGVSAEADNEPTACSRPGNGYSDFGYWRSINRFACR